MKLHIIVPTIRTLEEIAPLVDEIKRTAGCECFVYATCTNGSASQNRNLGLDWATSDPLIMLDDDVEQFPQGWAVELCDVLRDRPNCVMVSPVLMTKGRPFMSGGASIKPSGLAVAHRRMLPTACVAVRRNDLRFDEVFQGSGFEDDDFCKQLCRENPNAEFLVLCDLRVVHRNEEKNGRGENWDKNRAYFQAKWGAR